MKEFTPFENGHPLDKWCFRRDGYTEQENPHQVGFIIANGDVFSPFRCAKLEPTTEEIMGTVIMMAPEIAERPTTSLNATRESSICLSRRRRRLPQNYATWWVLIDRSLAICA